MIKNFISFKGLQANAGKRLKRKVDAQGCRS